MNSSEKSSSIQIESVEDWEPPEGQPGKGLLLRTRAGDIEAILHSRGDTPTRKGIVWVWGARGGFDGPADGIYGVLAEEMKSEVTSLRVNYRYPSMLDGSIFDTLAGVSYLKSLGCDTLALVGHSFGGAVVISAAPFSAEVKTVVALSSQTRGAAAPDRVAPRPLLLVHGADDTRLPPMCSEAIYEWADEPKELVIYLDAGHSLHQCKDELHDLLRRWIPEKLDSADV